MLITVLFGLSYALNKIINNATLYCANINKSGIINLVEYMFTEKQLKSDSTAAICTPSTPSCSTPRSTWQSGLPKQRLTGRFAEVDCDPKTSHAASGKHHLPCIYESTFLRELFCHGRYSLFH